MRRMLLVVLLPVGLLAAACQSSGGTINIYNDPYHQLVIRDVLPFSTARTDATPARRVRVKNVGQQNLTVNDVRIVGSSAFRLVASQDRSFVLTSGQETTISVEYRPSAITNPDIKGVRHTASMFVDSSDAAQPSDEVFLRGWQAADYENNKEPNRDQIVKTIGYTTTVGTNRPTSAFPAGEDIRSAYWRRVDPARPVTLFPLARYASRTTGATGRTSWYVQGQTALRHLHDFDGGDINGSGGENQKLVPTPSAGPNGIPGTVTFDPGTSAFGISMFASGDQMYSDDARNGASTHNFRFWPAEGRSNERLADAWIVGNDLGFDGNPLKNNDYQDFMWVLSNARPA